MEESEPELIPFNNVCYGQSSFICYGDFLVTSEQGFEQGDPLGQMNSETNREFSR